MMWNVSIANKKDTTQKSVLRKGITEGAGKVSFNLAEVKEKEDLPIVFGETNSRSLISPSSGITGRCKQRYIKESGEVRTSTSLGSLYFEGGLDDNVRFEG